LKIIIVDIMQRYFLIKLFLSLLKIRSDTFVIYAREIQIFRPV